MGEDLKDIRKHLGARLGKLSGSAIAEVQVRDGLPDSFDARQKWPDCANRIGEIRNQASCGSCWVSAFPRFLYKQKENRVTVLKAVSSASVASDRNCIATDGHDNVQLSAEDILACCGHYCGDGYEDKLIIPKPRSKV